MDLFISSFSCVDDDHVPFHVDRFSKNAVGLIVYMTEYLIVDSSGGEGQMVKYPLTWYSNILITVLRATRSALCSEIPFNSTLYIYSFYLNP
jgi:hypothetical protein